MNTTEAERKAAASRAHRAGLVLRFAGVLGLGVGMVMGYQSEVGSWKIVGDGVFVLAAAAMGLGALLIHRRESSWANAFLALTVAGAVGVVVCTLVQAQGGAGGVLRGGFRDPGMLSLTVVALVLGDMGLSWFMRKGSSA